MNESIQKTEGRTLPTILELRDDQSLALREQDNALNVLLNEPPSDTWIAEHPYAKGVRFIPIARLEWLMTRVFIKWHIEVREVSLIANSIGVTVRVHYLNPTNGEWQWMDGVGAVAMQVDKEAGATDFSRIKSNAVQIGLPAAKSYAFKDAVETIGKLFGKDLNRRDLIDYRPMLTQFPEDEPALPFPRTAVMENGSGLESTEGIVVDIQTEMKHAKKKTDPDYPLYKVILDNGSSLTTFDEATYLKALNFKDLGENALIEFQQEKYGRRILSISEA